MKAVESRYKLWQILFTYYGLQAWTQIRGILDFTVYVFSCNGMQYVSIIVPIILEQVYELFRCHVIIRMGDIR